MNKAFFLQGSLALIAIGASQNLHAFAEIARGTLVADIDLRFIYDTNVFGNSSEEEDVSSSLTPSLSYRRNVAKVTTSATASVSAISFNDYTEQNTIDPTAGLRFDYDAAENGNASVALDYSRSTQTNDALLTRTSSDEYRGTGSMNYFYSEKTGIRVNGGYRVSNYSTTGFNNVSSYNFGGGLVYRYSPKLTASLVYGFSPEKASNLAAGVGDPSSNNHRLSLGFEGELAPKVTGNVSGGVVYRDFDGPQDSQSTVLANVGLSWLAAQKTTATLAISNDFDTTASGQSVQNLTARIGVRQALTEKLSGGATLTYGRSEYEQSGVVPLRTDNSLTEAIDLSYSINDHFSTGTGVSFRTNDSDSAAAEYGRLTWFVNANLNF
jgi:polysaccharide biosynthesis protein VpsM